MVPDDPGKSQLMTVGTGERLRYTDIILLKQDKEKYDLLVGCNIQENRRLKKQVVELLLKIRLVGLLKLKFAV